MDRFFSKIGHVLKGSRGKYKATCGAYTPQQFEAKVRTAMEKVKNTPIKKIVRLTGTYAASKFILPHVDRHFGRFKTARNKLSKLSQELQDMLIKRGLKGKVRQAIEKGSSSSSSGVPPLRITYP